MLMILGTLADAGAAAPDQLEELLLDIAAGDREALLAFYDRTRRSVYGLALSYLKNGHDAEDVTQDTYVRVWDTAPGYRPQGKPMGWVLTIAKNFALMRLRRRGREQDLPQEDWESLAVDSPAVTAEDRAVLQAALGALDDQERQAVLLHAVSGLKHREIAEILELPLPTVLSKYHRALKKLRKQLEGGDAL